MRAIRQGSIALRRGRLFSTEAVPSASTSSSQPPKWTRPIQPGVNPAYDLALEVIEKNANKLKGNMAAVRKELEKASGEEAKALQAQLHKLEIESEINSPEVRWNFKNHQLDLSRPVYRHLAERAWRKEGPLDLILQRIWQMHVIPDILPTMEPTIDFKVHFDLATSEPVEPGVYLHTSQTIAPPRLQTTVFHPDTRLYTLVMIDGDVPDPSSQSFTTYLHWLKPNIPLSSESSFKDIDTSDALVSYLPPHPPSGTPYHRYVTMLLPQQDPNNPITIPDAASIERRGFNMRKFIQEMNLSTESGGVHMWRAKYDDGVSRIYEEILKTPEPRFGPAPKADPYGGRRDRKYI